MRDRVTFQRRAVADDGAGNAGRTGPWSDEFTCRAEIVPLKGSEQVIAARLSGVQPATIRVRYTARTAAITSEWRVYETLRPDVVYDIETAADMERRRALVTMVCKAGVPT